MKIHILLILLFTGFMACEKMEEYEPEKGPVWPVSGEWWVTWEFDLGGTVADHFGFGHVRFLTYNTAANNADSIWCWDYGQFWDMKVKTGLNLPNRAFSVTEGKNKAYDSRVTIQNARVYEREDGDSIYMEILFNDDADWTTGTPSPYHNTYIVSGRRVRGFLDSSGSTSYDADYGDD